MLSLARACRGAPGALTLSLVWVFIEIDVGDSADDPPRSELVIVAAIELEESTGSAKAIK